MWHFDFISHKDLDNKTLGDIIEIKNKVWHYPYLSHYQWIDKNLCIDDFHLLLWEESELIGYLNLVHLNGTIEAWGIGNVVVNPYKQGRNIGYLLMSICDSFLVRTKKPGMLICKDSVLGFYKKNGWNEFMGQVICQSAHITHHFFTRHLDNTHYNIIEIDRLF